MSRGVDVLSIMEDVADGLRMEGFKDSATPLEDARDAVAELIEAVDKIAKSSPDECGSYYTNRANIRIAKEALARVRGPK